MFRTDGDIVYCGRKDRQIKFRGRPIELGEIEDVVSKYQSAQRAAVLIRNFHDAPAVVAFVEFKSSVTGDHVVDEKEALKMYISERLPRFMYPSLIVGSCPNVEAVTATGGLSLVGAKTLSSYGKGLERLKRVAGVEEGCVQLGRLRCILVGGTRSLTVYCGSYAGLPGPPGDLYQGYNRDLPHACCKSSC